MVAPINGPCPMRLAVICALTLAGLTGCTQFPELDGTVSPAVANAPPPELVPLAPLLAQANSGQTTANSAEAAQQALTSRLASLRARADRLRGPVLPAATRARMIRAMRAAR